MSKKNNEVDRREFIKSSAQAAATAAVAAAGLDMGIAQGAVPRDKKMSVE